MIDAEYFLEQLQARDFSLVCGVPCSYLTPLINAASESPRLRYVNAANEGDAVAVAAGAELAGRRSLVMFQNSGLGNAVNPLTSLAVPFQIPLLLIVTWRGEPGGRQDEPQHELMGAITPAMLDLMGIAWERFPTEKHAVEPALDRVATHFTMTQQPYALVMSQGCVATRELSQIAAERTPRADAACSCRPQPAFDQDDVLRLVQNAAGPRDILVSTTGYTSRALYALADRDNQLYVVGSMGCASSVALGIALARPDHRVLLLDGDGAVLMRPSALACIGSEAPANLVHLILDNGVHDSTGAQATLASHVAFCGLARACGYPDARDVESLDQLAEALHDRLGGLRLLHVRTRPRSQTRLPRPTLTPAETAQRLRQWISTHDRSQRALAAP